MKTSNGFLGSPSNSSESKNLELNWGYLSCLCSRLHKEKFIQMLSPRREPLFVVVVVVPLLFVSIIQKLGVHYAYSDKMAPTYFVFSTRTNIWIFVLKMAKNCIDFDQRIFLIFLKLKMHCCNCTKSTYTKDWILLTLEYLITVHHLRQNWNESLHSHVEHSNWY